MFRNSIQQRGWLVIPLLYCMALFQTCTGQYQYPQLNKFLGRWLEVRKEGFEKFANDLGKTIGLTQYSRPLFEKSRTIVVFSKTADIWIVRVGVEGGHFLRTYTFRFGKPYFTHNIDGMPLNGVVHLEGDRFVGRYESIIEPYYVMDVVWEVEDDTMTTWTTVKGESVESIFKRDGKIID